MQRCCTGQRDNMQQPVQQQHVRPLLHGVRHLGAALRACCTGCSAGEFRTGPHSGLLDGRAGGGEFRIGP